MTLIELLMVLAIAALVFGFAWPSYRDWVAATTVRNAAEALTGALNRARSAAVQTNRRVVLCKSADRSQCSTTDDWSQGWIVFVDDDRDGTIGADKAILYVEAGFADGIHISGNHPVGDYVSYTSLGHARMRNGALQMGTFAVCRAGQNALQVVLAHSGRARIVRTHSPC